MLDVLIQTAGQPEILKKLEGLEHLVDVLLMERIGSLAEFLIKQRTAQGKDVRDQLFKPYSEKYKLFRQEKGRDTGTPNLFFSGQMLGAMTHKVEGDDTVKIFFADSQAAAKASGNQRKRAFFGLSADEVRQITAEIETELEQRANQ